MPQKAGDLPRNLYRDLRDRRLLVIVIVLVAAIIAVPLLVKSEGVAEQPAPPGSAAAGTDPAAELDSVVVAETTALRNFRSRLEESQSRNPFKQQLLGPVGGGSADETSAGEGGTGGGAVTDPSSATGTSTVDPVTSAGTTDPVPVPDPEPVPDPVVDPSPTPATPDDGSSEETKLISTRVDVVAGPVGKTKIVKDVKALEFLPDRARTVVEFLQGDFDLTSAIFAVSRGVISTEGEGRCVPNPNSCEFLELNVDEEQSFEYADGKRYRLKLLEVTLHEQPLDPPEEVPAGRKSGRDFNTFSAPGKVVGD